MTWLFCTQFPSRHKTNCRHVKNGWLVAGAGGKNAAGAGKTMPPGWRRQGRPRSTSAGRSAVLRESGGRRRRARRNWPPAAARRRGGSGGPRCCPVALAAAGAQPAGSRASSQPPRRRAICTPPSVVGRNADARATTAIRFGAKSRPPMTRNSAASAGAGAASAAMMPKPSGCSVTWRGEERRRCLVVRLSAGGVGRRGGAAGGAEPRPLEAGVGVGGVFDPGDAAGKQEAPEFGGRRAQQRPQQHHVPPGRPGRHAFATAGAARSPHRHGFGLVGFVVAEQQMQAAGGARRFRQRPVPAPTAPAPARPGRCR